MSRPAILMRFGMLSKLSNELWSKFFEPDFGITASRDELILLTFSECIDVCWSYSLDVLKCCDCDWILHGNRSKPVMELGPEPALRAHLIAFQDNLRML
jgi:hypothetical protein